MMSESSHPNKVSTGILRLFIRTGLDERRVLLMLMVIDCIPYYHIFACNRDVRYIKGRKYVYFTLI